MNLDEEFNKRWELRCSKVVADTSSDEEGSDSRGKSVASYDEAEAEAEAVNSRAVKADEKKLKSSKKKRKRKRKRKHGFNGKAMLEDLKAFADSLVQELAVAKQDMLANMRDEMSKLVASSSSSVRKKAKKVSPVRRPNEVSKGERVRLATAINMINPAPSLCIATAIQNRSIYNSLINSHIQLGCFYFNRHKTWGLYGEGHPNLPIPLRQGMEIGASRPRTGVSIAKIPGTSRAPPPTDDPSLVARLVLATENL